MEISQLQVTYLDKEDRLLLRINLGTEKHLSVFVTRRVCLFMLEQLSIFLKISTPIGQDRLATVAPQHPDHDDEDTDTDHPGGRPKLDKSTPFQERSQEGNLLGVGVAPPLVVDASCSHTPEHLDFTWVMVGRNPFNIHLARDLAIGLHDLLTAASNGAKWFTNVSATANPVDNQLNEAFQTLHKPGSTIH